MENKIYVGNLPFSVTNETLAETFERFGSVESAKIIIDRDTNRSKGFGFVEMATADEAAEVVSTLDGSDLEGRNIRVNIAKPQAPRENRGGFRNNRY